MATKIENISTRTEDIIEVAKKSDIFTSSNTRITDFLYKTSKDVLADVIDPLNTFDVEFLFSPSLFCDDGSSIYGYKAYHYDNSFLKSLAETILLIGKLPTLVFNNTLTLLIGYYVLSMTIPQMTMPEAGKVQTLMGEFPVNNLYVKVDTNTFQMSILNTKVSLHDFIFYPWMREITMPCWSYDKQPYTTATVTVKFDKHSNSRYVFCGCRPSQIESRQPTLEPEGTTTRAITMLFDYMYITDAVNNKNVYDVSLLENAYSQFSNLDKMQSRFNLTL